MGRVSHSNVVLKCEKYKPILEVCVSASLCSNLPFGELLHKLQLWQKFLSNYYFIHSVHPIYGFFSFHLLSDPPSHPHYPSLDLQQCYGVYCAVCIREAENKSSVRYEVIAGIISIINQRFSRGAGREVEKREVGGVGGQRMRGREGGITVCNF